MKQVAVKSSVVARELMKGYIRLLTQQTVLAAKKIDAFFFGPNGEDAELRKWYYTATAFYIAIGLFVFVAIN